MMKNNKIKTQQFTILGSLPGMSEIIDAAKIHWSNYSKMKEKYTNIVIENIWESINSPLIKYDEIDVDIFWIEPNYKRDYDNIMGGQKFIFDGIRTAGIISDDSQKHIGSITNHFDTDKINPRIIVTVKGEK